MDSLYGGRPGTPFVLKATYKSIEEMKNAFSEGSSYTACYYGEFCMIDTVDKHHEDNGKIFRRDYTGATYIGRIVGPSGLRIDNIRFLEYSGPIDYYDGSSFEIVEDKYEPTKTISLKAPNTGEEELGYTLKNNYKYLVYDITNEQYSYDSDTGETISQTWTCFIAYYNILEDIQLEDNGTITRKFSASQDINDGKEKVTWINSISLDKDNGKFNITLNNKSKTNDEGLSIQDGVSQINKDLTWVKNIKIDDKGTIYYDTTTGNNENIEINSENFDGTQDYIQSEKISWIKNISLDEETGKFNITLNNGTQISEDDDKNGLKKEDNGLSQINKDLTWVKSIDVDDGGTVHYDTTTGDKKTKEYVYGEDGYNTQDYKQSHLIKWINDITFNDDKSSFSFESNVHDYTKKNEEEETTSIDEIDKTFYLPYIKKLSYDNEKGEITETHANVENGDDETSIINEGNLIEYAKNINIESGNIVVTTNINNKYNANKEKNPYNSIEDIIINDTGGGSITIKYTSDSKNYSETPKTVLLNRTVQLMKIFYTDSGYDNSDAFLDELNKEKTVDEDGNEVLNALQQECVSYRGSLIGFSKEETVDDKKQTQTNFFAYDVKTDAWIDLGNVTQAVTLNSTSGSKIDSSWGELSSLSWSI